MSRFALANLCGLVFGALTVLSMLPMSFPDKRAALLGAFFNRFAIGFVIILIDIPCSGWLIGLTIGILLSLPPAIITKVFVPILGIGAVGGVIIDSSEIRRLIRQDYGAERGATVEATFGTSGRLSRRKTSK